MPSIKKSKPRTKTKPSVFKSTEPFQTVTLGKTEVFILGTAHVSEKSIEEVERCVQELKPDVICVELCESRLKSIQDPHYLQKLDIFKVFKERKMWLLLSTLILSSFQKKLGMGKVKPGDELKKAVQLAKAKETKLVPIDREIQTTLKRAWGTVNFFSKYMLFSLLLTSLFTKEELSHEKIEELKSEDVLKDLFSQLPSRYDAIKRVIIDERDMYLAEKVRREAELLGKGKIFVVIGAGHLQGMVSSIHHKVELAPLDELPLKSPFAFLKWASFPIFFSALIGLTYYRQGSENAQDLVLSLLIVKSVLAGLGGVLALAHPISILLAAFFAPIGTFIPILKPGWIAGLSESWLRKPLVSDFERIAEDTEHWTGFWKNNVIRIFLVFLLPQFGSSLGTILITWKGVQFLF